MERFVADVNYCCKSQMLKTKGTRNMYNKENKSKNKLNEVTQLKTVQYKPCQIRDCAQ